MLGISIKRTKYVVGTPYLLLPYIIPGRPYKLLTTLSEDTCNDNTHKDKQKCEPFTSALHYRDKLVRDTFLPSLPNSSIIVVISRREIRMVIIHSPQKAFSQLEL